MMYKWLPVNLTANVPVYAHTMIGVGGLVVNDNRQILTIKENHAIVKGAWKLPGGYVEPGKKKNDFEIFNFFFTKEMTFKSILTH